jgi:hypothetical protein
MSVGFLLSAVFLLSFLCLFFFSLLFVLCSAAAAACVYNSIFTLHGEQWRWMGCVCSKKTASAAAHLSFLKVVRDFIVTGKVVATHYVYVRITHSYPFGNILSFVNAMDICRVISLLLLSFFASFFSISTS